MNGLDEAYNLIESSKNIIVLTGAGLSTSAGIPDFRGPNGIYTKGAIPEELFGYENFLKSPLPFWNFAREFMELLKKANPTFMHQFLAKLENDLNKNVMIVTQNIDGLHQKAGSKNVIEFHGSFEKSYCLSCSKIYNYDDMIKKIESEEIPRCDKCKGLIKPDIVFFGEPVKGIEESIKFMLKADIMLIIGTSLAIAPASYLPQYYKGTIITINGEEIFSYVNSDIFIKDDIEKVAQDFLKRLNK